MAPQDYASTGMYSMDSAHGAHFETMENTGCQCGCQQADWSGGEGYYGSPVYDEYYHHPTPEPMWAPEYPHMTHDWQSPQHPQGAQTITLVPTGPPSNSQHQPQQPPVVVTEYVIMRPAPERNAPVLQLLPTSSTPSIPPSTQQVAHLYPVRQPKQQPQPHPDAWQQQCGGYSVEEEDLTDSADGFAAPTEATPPPSPPNDLRRPSIETLSSSDDCMTSISSSVKLTHFEVGVQFKHGRVGEFVYPQSVHLGTHCVVEGDRGQDLGVVVACKEVAYRREDLRRRLKIKRFATEEEVRRWRMMLVQEEQKALDFMRQQAERQGIPINLHAAEFQFDRKKLTFHYSTGMGHPDFRNLLRNGYKQFRCRIWMNNCKPQVGEPGDALQVPPAPVISSCSSCSSDAELSS